MLADGIAEALASRGEAPLATFPREVRVVVSAMPGPAGSRPIIKFVNIVQARNHVELSY
jgi:hypothetical protein